MMINQPKPNPNQSPEELDLSRAALKRIQKILAYDPHLTDDDSMVICSNDIADDAQGFIRDYLDMPEADISDEFARGYREHLPRDFAQRILDDLKLIWDCEFYRDELSQIAMSLSLCPMHFGDWASCFDDQVDECSQIRAIFPYGHDT